MRQKNPERVSVRGFFFVRPFSLSSLFDCPTRLTGRRFEPGGSPYFSTRVMTTCGIPASTNSSPSTLKPWAW